MLNSTVLEVAIGLVFCFASVSLIASSVNEAIASALKLRAGTLLEGVKSLLNDPGFTGLALALYNHALVDPQDAGHATSESDLKYKPSYIPSKQFAIAFTDLLSTAPGTIQQFDQTLSVVKDDQLRQLLLGMSRRAAGDLDKFHAQLADWFDNAMERVSGGYKRRSQLISFVIALVAAGLFNIDSFRLFQTLWDHPALVAQVSSPQVQDLPTAIAGLKSLPIGWQNVPPLSVGSAQTWVMIAGWLVAASSALFGAPFWFDLLQKLIQLRGTGQKPKTANET